MSYTYHQKVAIDEQLKGKVVEMVTCCKSQESVDFTLTFTDGTWLEVYISEEDDGDETTLGLGFEVDPTDFIKRIYISLDGPWVRCDKWDGDVQSR